VAVGMAAHGGCVGIQWFGQNEEEVFQN